ncbi:MAG: hypothetical protein CMF99_02625, partial [Candidatus Marinimicrobia bacterium]|nr:hypothetical protein [Candidatus Neomarinimicrobiota bacterium]
MDEISKSMCVVSKFAIVKSYSTIKNASDFPSTLDALWHDALTQRSGPVVLELPVDMSYK